ncbi:multidrug transporter subunit MdtG, partial [Candidatus Erwinia dacicola]|nr:multidrug transporter subunit MdtG [Candidatus Erwinia dacicola]
GPLMGSGISAIGGFRWVFAATALVVLINSVQLIWVYRKSARGAD